MLNPKIVTKNLIQDFNQLKINVFNTKIKSLVVQFLIKTIFQLLLLELWFHCLTISPKLDSFYNNRLLCLDLLQKTVSDYYLLTNSD